MPSSSECHEYHVNDGRKLGVPEMASRKHDRFTVAYDRQKNDVEMGAITSMPPTNTRPCASSHVTSTAVRGSSPSAEPYSNHRVYGNSLSRAMACSTRLPPNSEPRMPSADEDALMMMPVTTRYVPNSLHAASCMIVVSELSNEDKRDVS